MVPSEPYCHRVLCLAPKRSVRAFTGLTSFTGSESSRRLGLFFSPTSQQTPIGVSKNRIHNQSSCCRLQARAGYGGPERGRISVRCSLVLSVTFLSLRRGSGHV